MKVFKSNFFCSPIENDANGKVFQSPSVKVTVSQSDTTENEINKQVNVEEEENKNVKDTIEQSSNYTTKNGATKENSKEASPTDSQAPSIDAYEDDPVKLLQNPIIQKKQQKRSTGAKTFACTHKVGCMHIIF